MGEEKHAPKPKSREKWLKCRDELKLSQDMNILFFKCTGAMFIALESFYGNLLH